MAEAIGRGRPAGGVCAAATSSDGQPTPPTAASALLMSTALRQSLAISDTPGSIAALDFSSCSMAHRVRELWLQRPAVAKGNH